MMRLLYLSMLVVFLSSNVFSITGVTEIPSIKTEPYTGLLRQEGQFIDIQSDITMNTIPAGKGWYHVSGTLNNIGIYTANNTVAVTCSGRGNFGTGHNTSSGIKAKFGHSED